MNTTEHNSGDTFLSDWLNGKITDEQLQQLIPEADFHAYRRLKDALNSYEIAAPDMDQNYAAIKTKLAASKSIPTLRTIRRYRYIAVAAAVLLLFGLFKLFIFSNHRETDFGKTASLQLPDHSKVTLEARSKVSYPSLFTYNRKLHLEGEAYFEVKKGSTFTVETKQGTIEVLGTKFSVAARPGYFEVICFEGRVRVAQNNKTSVLTPGKAVRHYKSQWETCSNGSKPFWIPGESTFRNAPLEYVLNKFRDQYRFDVQYPETLKNVRFTGSFTHKNSATALQSICVPMQLQYTQTGNKIIISE